MKSADLKLMEHIMTNKHCRF